MAMNGGKIDCLILHLRYNARTKLGSVLLLNSAGAGEALRKFQSSAGAFL